jgi:hypothetical protein
MQNTLNINMKSIWNMVICTWHDKPKWKTLISTNVIHTQIEKGENLVMSKAL